MRAKRGRDLAAAGAVLAAASAAVVGLAATAVWASSASSAPLAQSGHRRALNENSSADYGDGGDGNTSYSPPPTLDWSENYEGYTPYPTYDWSEYYEGWTPYPTYDWSQYYEGYTPYPTPSEVQMCLSDPFGCLFALGPYALVIYSVGLALFLLLGVYLVFKIKNRKEKQTSRMLRMYRMTGRTPKWQLALRLVPRALVWTVSPIPGIGNFVKRIYDTLTMFSDVFNYCLAMISPPPPTIYLVVEVDKNGKEDRANAIVIHDTTSAYRRLLGLDCLRGALKVQGRSEETLDQGEMFGSFWGGLCGCMYGFFFCCCACNSMATWGWTWRGAAGEKKGSLQFENCCCSWCAWRRTKYCCAKDVVVTDDAVSGDRPTVVKRAGMCSWSSRLFLKYPRLFLRRDGRCSPTHPGCCKSTKPSLTIMLPIKDTISKGLFDHLGDIFSPESISPDLLASFVPSAGTGAIGDLASNASKLVGDAVAVSATSLRSSPIGDTVAKAADVTAAATTAAGNAKEFVATTMDAAGAPVALAASKSAKVAARAKDAVGAHAVKAVKKLRPPLPRGKIPDGVGKMVPLSGVEVAALDGSGDSDVRKKALALLRGKISDKLLELQGWTEAKVMDKLGPQVEECIARVVSSVEGAMAGAKQSAADSHPAMVATAKEAVQLAFGALGTGVDEIEAVRSAIETFRGWLESVLSKANMLAGDFDAEALLKEAVAGMITSAVEGAKERVGAAEEEAAEPADADGAEPGAEEPDGSSTDDKSGGWQSKLAGDIAAAPSLRAPCEAETPEVDVSSLPEELAQVVRLLSLAHGFCVTADGLLHCVASQVGQVQSVLQQLSQLDDWASGALQDALGKLEAAGLHQVQVVLTSALGAMRKQVDAQLEAIMGADEADEELEAALERGAEVATNVQEASGGTGSWAGRLRGALSTTKSGAKPGVPVTDEDIARMKIHKVIEAELPEDATEKDIHRTLMALIATDSMLYGLSIKM